MRPIGLGLVVALVAALLSPTAVMAAAKPTFTEAQRKQGMTEAPPLVQQANLPCQVSDARFIGKSPEDKKNNIPAQTYYEVACQAGQTGFLVVANAGKPPASYTCVEANTPPAPGKPAAAPCLLPGNDKPEVPIAAALTKANVPCTPTGIRGIGQSKENTYMEIACEGPVGYLLIGSAPFDTSKKIEAQNCLNFDDRNDSNTCRLSDKAARLAILDKYNADAKTGCVIKDRKFAAAMVDGSSYYEVACQDGKGYFYKTNAARAFTEATECGKAQGLFGGCTLTDARQAINEQAGLYTSLAKKAGSNCEVASYQPFPPRGTDDVIEMTCKDGSRNVGIFKADGKGEIVDCGKAEVTGYRCGAARGPTYYAALTADLQKMDRKECTVSNSRMVGKNDKGNAYIEVACSDGLPGYFIEYKSDPVTPVQAIACRLAGGCTLPGNKS
jgi:hypothetical protein